MIAASVFLGFVLGVAVMILVALWLAAKPKTEANPATSTFSALGMDISGQSTTMEATNARLLENVLRSASDHKLWEVTFPTRH
jgi:hypothetical protein